MFAERTVPDAVSPPGGPVRGGAGLCGLSFAYPRPCRVGFLVRRGAPRVAFGGDERGRGLCGGIVPP
ncbi:hypothetical protein HMPREF1138_0600 [Actinomyces sp. ICM58]|nr:hypothetical protein HMPREF1138_0600 [Actinomyces sp. ICM58]